MVYEHSHLILVLGSWAGLVEFSIKYQLINSTVGSGALIAGESKALASIHGY